MDEPSQEPLSTGPQSFARWAVHRCPPLAELMLAVNGELAEVDVRAADRRLDELALPLFGLSAAGGADQAEGLVAVLTGEHGFVLDEADPHGLLLGSVLAEGRGHPLMLAVVVAEAGRRAGIATAVYSSPGSWYAGVFDDEALWLVETQRHGSGAPPRLLWRHCGHELASAALRGLGRLYARAGIHELAERTVELGRELPGAGHGRGVGLASP